MRILITISILICLLFIWIFILALLHNSNKIEEDDPKMSDEDFEKLIMQIRKEHKKKK